MPSAEFTMWPSSVPTSSWTFCARTAGRPTTTDETRNIGRALAPFLDGGTAEPVPSILNLAGGGTARLVTVRIGGDREDGVLVAGSRQTGFPSEADHLLLTVGANQAAAVLQHQRAEEALRESEGRFRGTFENAAVGIAHTHPTGRFLRVNAKLCAIVGYPREELLQNTSQDITHPDDLAASVASLAAVSRGESPALAPEERYRRKEGSSVWVG